MHLNRWFRKNKLTIGFLLAPLVAPITFLIFISAAFVFCKKFNIHYNPASAVVLPIITIRYGIPGAYIFAFVLGLPYVWFMRSRGLLNFKTVIIPTILFAIIFAFLSRFIVTGVTNNIWLAWSLYVFIATGPWIILSGVCFYLLSARNSS